MDPATSSSPHGPDAIDLDALLPPFAPRSSGERWLFSLHRLGIRPGLDAIAELLERLGRPQDAFEAFVVAGTNGKGSASITLAELFRSSGQVTGLYTSPHLLDIRERIVVDGEPIATADLDALVDEHRDLIEELGTTFFESLTALTYLHFARKGVQVAVLEAGLGGRLDATNVSNKAAVLLTSVGRDHEELLGRSLEAIAREKLGLAASGVPFYLESLGQGLETLAADFLRGVGAPAIRVDELSPDGTELDALHVEGRFQRRQFVRLCAVHADCARRHSWPSADPSRVKETLRLPGRYDVRGNHPRLVLDTAHNEQALERLLRQWSGEGDRESRILVFATVHGKSIDAIYPMIEDVAGTILVTAPRWYRAHAPEEVAAHFSSGASSRVEVHPDVAAALERARALATSPEASILVTGSNFLVGEALDRLGFDDLRDVGTSPLWESGGALRRRVAHPAGEEKEARE